MKPGRATFSERLDRFVRWFFDVSPNEGLDLRKPAEHARARREKTRSQQRHLRVHPAGPTRHLHER
jgi:hypothetical protein